MKTKDEVATAVKPTSMQIVVGIGMAISFLLGMIASSG